MGLGSAASQYYVRCGSCKAFSICSRSWGTSRRPEASQQTSMSRASLRHMHKCGAVYVHLHLRLHPHLHLYAHARSWPLPGTR